MSWGTIRQSHARSLHDCVARAMPVPTTTTARTGGGVPGSTNTGSLAPKGCHGRGRGEEGFVTDTTASMVLRAVGGQALGVTGPS